MASGHEMRVSDAEREAAAAELREHFASGRLDQEELNERLDRVFAARTRGDLNAQFTDLPSAGHAQAGAGAPGGGPAFGGPFGRARHSGGAGRGRRLAPGPGQRRTGAPWPGGPGSGAGLAGSRSPAVVALCLLTGFGIMAATGTGIGGGRPFGIILLLAAFALLRRLLFIIFRRCGRRGAPRGGSPRPRASARVPPAARAPSRYPSTGTPSTCGDKIVVRDLWWKEANFRSEREVRWRCVITLPFPLARRRTTPGHGLRTRC